MDLEKRNNALKTSDLGPVTMGLSSSAEMKFGPSDRLYLSVYIITSIFFLEKIFF
jgi:hypothetical protein